VETLLQKRAEVDAMNHEGTTPLHEAAYNGHADVIRLLLDAGANADGTPPLGAELALASKSLTAALRLNCGALFGCGGAGAAAAAERDDNGGAGAGGGGGAAAADGGRGRRGAAGGSTPLHWAVRRAAVAGSVEAVGLLIAAGASIDAVDAAGETPLHKAAHNGDAEVCERLLEAGAVLEARNRNGGTPLRSAAAAGQVVTCMVLLSAGADMGDGASGGGSGGGGSGGSSSAITAAVGDAAALLSHVRGWCATAAETLPDEQRGWLLRTRALQKAAVRVMVMQKAALDGHMSETDFDAAAAATTDAVVAEAHLKSLLTQLGAAAVAKETVLEVAAGAVASLDDETATALRLAFPSLFAAGTPPRGGGAAPPLPPAAGATPLHRAAAAGDADKLLTLLGTGASADVRDAVGRTPLHAAAAGGSAQACKVLLAGGASLDAWYQARPAYAPHERVSALVYGTAALFRGGTPLDVAVGDAVPVLREATQREAARASRVQGPSSASGSRHAGSSSLNGVRALSRQGSGGGGSRASGGTASPASFAGSAGGPPRMGGTAEEAIAAAEADALAAAEAAALATEAEMDADAAATEDPSATNLAAAAAAARWARDRAAAAAAAQMTLSEARSRSGPRAHELLPHAHAHRRASLAGPMPM
jgi:ankyrin repeat protein